ncbi:Predicted secreted protein [Variovorax sp. HW608]|uniref:SIMPL domain-containing protein n=1 Tax=Variovorax sp. HW608 TaxID=1034889 RepID=UPI00081FE998|nr:SIMPL domain-containing protein [Variovorax sp. HW608]SCK53498.1 Predicted secreted protein [Variovorax sp. HW608]
MNKARWLAACAVLTSASAAWSQAVTLPPPQNVLQLSSDATVEVQQDQLSMTLSTTRDGADASAVQAQLKSALDAALAEARKSAQPGQLDVHTGNFTMSPRRSREGKLTGWQGTAELILEGRDFPRIAQTAGRISTLTVGNVGFSLSREERAKAEAEAQGQAIDNFKQRADELAKRLGFAGYTLREVAVNSHLGGPIRPRVMAMEAAKMAADAPLPIEAGKTSVVVNVSGSVQLK